MFLGFYKECSWSCHLEICMFYRFTTERCQENKNDSGENWKKAFRQSTKPTTEEVDACQDTTFKFAKRSWVDWALHDKPLS